MKNSTQLTLDCSRTKYRALSFEYVRNFLDLNLSISSFTDQGSSTPRRDQSSLHQVDVGPPQSGQVLPAAAVRELEHDAGSGYDDLETGRIRNRRSLRENGTGYQRLAGYQYRILSISWGFKYICFDVVLGIAYQL